MNEQLEERPAARAITTGDRIDVVCDAFERQWLRSTRPRIEDYLNASGIHERSRLFRELLAVEIEYRHRASEPFSAAEYAARFGDLAPDVDAVFQSIAAADTDTGKRDPSVLAQHPDAPTRVNATPIAGGQPHTDSLAATMTLADVSGSSPLGKFRLMQVVGRGAFGEVYRAYDTELDRYVAVKLPRHSDMDSVETSRFLREAKNVSRLTHPGIVPVFDVGRTDSSCYIISEFVEGPTLAEELLRRRFSFREAADLVAHIGDALEHAHRAGVIHRDLKPSNILLDTHVDPTPSTSSASRSRGAATGKSFPRIVDFGLGKRSLGGASLMAGDEVIGTPAYMSPEQAAGHSHAVDGRSDVYSLGVVLYQMLTGELPFQGDLSQVLDRVINEPPKRPREINAAIPRDLEVICLKCLAKQRDARYFSASEVSADLRRWLEGMPILARPTPLLERAWSWCRRHSGVAAMIAVTVLVTVIGAVAVAVQWRQRVEADRLAAEKTIDNLLSVPSAELAGELEQVRADQGALEPHIRDRLREDLTLSQPGRIRLQLALLPVMPELADGLLQSMLTNSTDAHEFLVLRAELKHIKRLEPILTREWQSAGADAASALRPLLALLAFRDDPAEIRGEIATIAEGISRMPADDTAAWVRAAQAVEKELAAALEKLFPATDQPERVRHGAGRALVALYIDQPDALIDRLFEADDIQHSMLVKALKAHRDRIVPLLQEQKQAPPFASEEAARRQANIATALVQMDDEQSWEVLSHQPDPRLQSYFIHSAAAKELPATTLTRRIRSESDPGILYALILSIGRYSSEAIGEINEIERAKVVAKLKEHYEHHLDAGVHCAARWLLKSWGHEADLAAIDNRLKSQTAIPQGRNWYLNSLGQCMVIVRGEDEAGRHGPITEEEASDATPDAWKRVRWTYAIAATETTWDEFHQFKPNFKDNYPDAENQSGVHPAAWAKAPEALAYCRWLSERERISDREQTVQEIKLNGEPGDFEFLVDLTKSGYRMPLDVEWQRACRAGTITTRFYGEKETALAMHYVQGIALRAGDVGAKMPNQFGLFDSYGNIYEWAIDELDASAVLVGGVQPLQRRILQGIRLGRMGGSYKQAADECHSEMRAIQLTQFGREILGMRLVRTLRMPTVLDENSTHRTSD